MISSLENLVKNLSKDEFKYSNQEFDNKTFNLVEGKGFFIYEFVTDFENFKEEFPSKEKFYSYLTDGNLLIKNMNMLLTLN